MQSPLGNSTRNFINAKGKDLLGRTAAFFDWQQSRNSLGFWPYSRSLEDAPRGSARIVDSRGTAHSGVNFASQDYLSLATSPDLKAAAIEAIQRFGVHSAGSAAVLGNTSVSLRLEAALGDFLKTPEVTLYPTGWAAGFGVSHGLVRTSDYILMDALSHSCLQVGANAATRNVSLFRHLDNEHVKALLSRIRRNDSQNGILVMTEGLFSMDSDSPDLPELQAICREHEATLMVDVAHDLGATGPNGTGQIGAQGMLGKIDIVMGSFSKTFGSNGGFVACSSPSVKQFLKVFSSSQTFSNALSPAQAATVLRALEIIQGARGNALREALAANIASLRGKLESLSLTAMGFPSPIVPVLVGREDHVRVASSLLPGLGVLTNMAEFPAVPQDASRFRLQVMAGHTFDETQQAALGVHAAITKARAERPATL